MYREWVSEAHIHKYFHFLTHNSRFTARAPPGQPEETSELNCSICSKLIRKPRRRTKLAGEEGELWKGKRGQSGHRILLRQKKPQAKQSDSWRMCVTAAFNTVKSSAGSAFRPRAQSQPLSRHPVPGTSSRPSSQLNKVSKSTFLFISASLTFVRFLCH